MPVQADFFARFFRGLLRQMFMFARGRQLDRSQVGGVHVQILENVVRLRRGLLMNLHGAVVLC